MKLSVTLSKTFTYHVEIPDGVTLGEVDQTAMFEAFEANTDAGVDVTDEIEYDGSGNPIDFIAVETAKGDLELRPMLHDAWEGPR